MIESRSAYRVTPFEPTGQKYNCLLDSPFACSRAVIPRGSHERATLKTQTRFDRDLGDYNFRYNPPDFARLKAEAKAVDRLAASCKAKQIRLVIINMPLTVENKALLDSNLHKDYKQVLANAARMHDFELIDADRKDSTLADFIDSVHLNNYGRKIQNMIAPQLALRKAQST